MRKAIMRVDGLTSLIPSLRKQLSKNRKPFWEKNQQEFEKNIWKLVNCFSTPKKWKVVLVASHLLSDKEIMPYAYNAWSTTDIVGASKRQGFEILMFFNSARMSFLSLPALIPFVVHEMEHVQQISRNPKQYALSALRDDLQWMEKEAEKAVQKFSDSFREEWMLESILYCYDKKGWSGAMKMAEYLHTGIMNQYGGGYASGMTGEEYSIFLEAKQKRNMQLFLDRFC